MNLINFFKTKKFLLLNIVLSVYVFTNLIGGAFKAAEIDAKEAINQAVRLASVI